MTIEERLQKLEADVAALTYTTNLNAERLMSIYKILGDEQVQDTNDRLERQRQRSNVVVEHHYHNRDDGGSYPLGGFML